MVAKQVELSWKRDLRVYWHSLKLQIRSAMSLRGAFALQIIGMIINNIALIAAWWFLFDKFGAINGWHSHELIGFFGINTLVFGLVMTFSVGVLDLPRHVDRGSLDGLLTKPSPLILQLAGGNLDASTFGDIILGLTITSWYIATTPMSAPKFALFLLAMTVSLVIFWCFAVLLPNLLAFYIFDSERISRYVAQLFLDSGIYPTGVLTGTLRVFLLTLVPGLFMGAVPLEALYRFGWGAALLGVAVASFWLWFSLWLFRRSVHRYESSNLVGAR